MENMDIKENVKFWVDEIKDCLTDITNDYDVVYCSTGGNHEIAAAVIKTVYGIEAYNECIEPFLD